MPPRDSRTVSDVKRERKDRLLPVVGEKKEARPIPQPTELPAEKPVRALQTYGIQLPIREINDKVEQITLAHQRKFGTNPAPGLIFDLLRAPREFDGLTYDELFRLPKSRREAHVFRVARMANIPDEEDEITDLQIVKDAIWALADRGKAGTPAMKGAVPMIDNDRLNAAFDRNPKLHKIYLEETAKVRMFNSQSVIAGFGQTDYLTKPLGVLNKAAGQIVGAIADTPYGLYLISQAVALDVADAADPRSLGDYKGPKRTMRIAEDMGKQIVDDVRHPLRNPGYLAMDVWAVLTAGAGGAARVSAAKAAPKGRKMYALRHRPVAGSVELGWGDFTATVPLSENAAIRAIQKPLLERRNKKMVARQKDGVFEEKNFWLYDEVFSTERKLSRERQVNAEIDFAIAAAPLVTYTKMNRWDKRGRSVMAAILSDPRNVTEFKRLRAKERIGLEKAVQVLMTDDPAPLNAWRAHHERAIAQAKREHKRIGLDDDLKDRDRSRQQRGLQYVIDAHELQLEALKLAEEVIANPSKRFRPFVEKTMQVSKAQEKIKKEILGLSDEVAEQAVAKIGAFVRGDQLIDLGDGKLGIVDTDPAPFFKKLEKEERNIANLEGKLKLVEKRLRGHELAGGTSVLKGELVAEQIKIKKAIESRTRALGRAENQLDFLRGQARPLERISPDSGYLPYHPERHFDRHLGPIPVPRLRKKRFGQAPPQLQPGLRYRNDGKAIEIGDFSWDVSALMMNEYKDTLKAAFATTQFKDLWSIGTKEFAGEYSHPIRNVASAPNDLKRVVTALEGKMVSKDAAALLDDASLDKLRKWAAPTIDEMNDMIAEGTAKKSEFRFVDERFIHDKVGGVPIEAWRMIDAVIGGGMQVINEPMRMLLIFLTPAYALNAGGNAMLSLIHQGPLALANNKRALRSHSLYGDEATAILDALGGETLTSSLVSEKSIVTAGSQALMKVWQKVTDQMFRRAAVIHELRRREVLKDGMTPEEAHAALVDPANKKALIESARASRQAMLDFNRLSWPERATLRHFLFIYSFVRASAIYGTRFVAEHPIKNVVTAQAGRDRIEDLEAEYGEMPSWFTRHGYFPGPFGLADPVQFNVPQMLTEMTYSMSSLFADKPYASPSDITSPALKFFTRAVTGRDEQGRELEDGGIPVIGGGTLGKSFMSLARETPIGFAIKRGAREKQERPLPDAPIESGLLDPVSSAMKREHAALDHGSFEGDGFWNQWGRVLMRSALPQDVEKEALNARAWRDLRDSDPERYVQHQIDRVNEMVSRQEKVVGSKAPEGVREAVEFVSKVALKLEEWRQDLKDGKGVEIKVPTHKQVAMEMVDILLEMDRVSEDEAKDLRKWVSEARSPSEAMERRLGLMWNHGGRAWKEWHERVNDIMYFDSAEFDVALEDGAAEGVGDYQDAAKAGRASKWEYGRRYYQFAAQYDEQYARMSSLDGSAGKVAAAEFRMWLQEQDKPVKIGDKVFPSPLRVRHMKKSPEQRLAAVRSAAAKTWAALTPLERELVGVPVTTEVLQGWHALEKILDDEEKARAPGEPTPTGRREQLAVWIGTKIPAFMQDYTFSKMNLAGRMRSLKPITTSPHASDWREMLDAVVTFRKQWEDAGYNNSQIVEEWKRNRAPRFRAWIATRSQGFQDEVAIYDRRIDEADNVTQLNFIERLVS